MNAVLVGAPFDDPGWLFEVKWDGFRVEAVVAGDLVELWTRGRQDAARYFGPFLAPPTWLSARSAVVDGEVIALDASGEPDFVLLQDRIRRRLEPGAGSSLVYEVFDLLHLDGRSLLDEPLEERKRLLAGVLRPDPRVRFSEHVEEHGVAFFAEARRRGLEGIMAKERRSPYLPGRRSDVWRKVKNRPEQELVVGGWAPGTGSAVDLVCREGRCRLHPGEPCRAPRGARDAKDRRASLRPGAAAATPGRGDLGQPGDRRPGRVRRVDRGWPRPPGRVQGPRSRQGSEEGRPRGAGRTGLTPRERWTSG
jgi:hypothetical protein